MNYFSKNRNQWYLFYAILALFLILSAIFLEPYFLKTKSSAYFDDIYNDSSIKVNEYCQNNNKHKDVCKDLRLLSITSLRLEGQVDQYLLTFSTSTDKKVKPLMYEASVKYNGKELQIRKISSTDYPWSTY